MLSKNTLQAPTNENGYVAKYSITANGEYLDIIGYQMEYND